MNKIYKAITVKDQGLFFESLAKKVFTLIIGLIGILGNAKAQVDIGGTPYGSLKLAFDAINSGAKTGAIIININATTNETAMAVLNSSGTGSASYSSVLIRPTTSVTITGTLTSSIIQLFGADNVTIDGLNGVSQLTISNTSTSTGSAVIWLGSFSATDGATNNIIRNCIIKGNSTTTTAFGISSSSGTTIGGLAEGPNSNNTYQANTINTCEIGISLVGGNTNDINNIVTGNSIGSATTINKLGHKGVSVFQQQNILISQNKIFGLTSTAGSGTFQTTGIYVGGVMSGGLIERNKISDIKISSFWGSSGIQLESSSTGINMTVANNFIFDVTSGGWIDANSIDDGGYGIAVSEGSGYNIYYNSIDMSTNQTGSSGVDPATAISAAFWISADITGTINVKNNIFSNRQTTGIRFDVFSNVTNSVFASIDYNDYYTPSGVSVGFITSVAGTLAAWQLQTGQDVNSLSVNPVFTSLTDLHLANTSPLDGFATPIAGVTIDIDGVTRNVATPDVGADEFTPPNCTSNTAGTISATALGICASGSTTLSATGYSLGTGISYQWQSSPDGITWTSLPGQTNPTSAVIGSIAATTQYHLTVTCSNCCGGAPLSSAPITITVNNPTVSGTTPGTRCGVGIVNLAATAAAGTINWYSAPTGGTSLHTGSPFTTPIISSTTPYYVSNSIINSTGSVGPAYTGAANLGTAVGFEGIVFSTTLPNISINSVDIPFTGTGTITISVKDVTNSITYSTYTTGSVTGLGTASLTIPTTLTVAAAGNYILIIESVTGTVGGLGFTVSAAYPYTALGGAFTISSGYFFGTGDLDYMYLYNLNVSSICEGLRTAVNATVTAPPVFTSVSPAAGPGRTICSGANINLNATSANGGYVYTWNPGSLIGAAQVVTPSTTTVYTLTANDGTCRRDSAVTITVFTTPSPLTLTPATATSCPGTLIPISVTGGLLLNQVPFSETLETFPTQFTLTGVGVTAAQNTTYYQQGSSSVLLTNVNNADGQYAMTTGINLSNYSTPKLTFYQICGTEPGFDFGYVQYSTDGGGSWNTFATGDYQGTGTLIGGQLRFDKTSYIDWNTQFTSSSSTPGTGPASSLWKLETINLAPYVASTNFKVRFRLFSDVNTIFYGWLIDNVKITGNAQANISWSPATNLYITNSYTGASSAGTTITCSTTTGLIVGMPVAIGGGTGVFQAGTTIASIINGTQFTVNLVPSTALSGAIVLAGYVPAVPSAPQVYSIPTAGITYTATATNGTCTSTGTSTITISAVAASLTIAATGGTTICQGSPITFTATTVNAGANPGFKWFVNGTQVNSPLGFNTNPGHNPFTITGLNNGDQVYCQMLSNAGGCVVPNNPKSDTLTMTVNPTPTVSIDGPLAVCFPSVLTVTTSPGITNYEWFLNGTSVGSLSTYNATGPGDYTCVVTAGTGCTDTSAHKILTQKTYNITPTVTNGTISPSGVVAVNCGANQSFTYAANPGGYILCDVIIDGSSVGTPASPYTFTNVTATHTIDVVFCIPGCATPSTVNAGPDASICANSNYTITGTSISGPPGITGTWSSSGGGTFIPGAGYGVATSYIPSVGDIGAGTVDLTITTNNPLGAPCAPATSTMTLTIKASPVLTLSGNLGICSVGSTTTNLSANATTTSGTISGYQWYNNVPTLIGSTAAQAISTTGNFSVKANGSNGCSTTTPFTIIAFTSPSTPTITGSNTICAGTSTNLTANVASPGNGGATITSTGYQWSNGSPIIGATNQIYTASSVATYTVTATNSNGCLSGTSTGFAVAYDVSPLNGAYTIGVGPASCTNYVSFATAINDLNTRTISGNVRFDIPAGYVETVPNLGLSLGSTALNASVGAKTISFNKSGVGANPVLNAYSGGFGTFGTSTPDGIWSLRGIDNVLINGINLFDGNISNPTTMDYGFGFFKLLSAGVYDGAQNNTIQNCTITLNRINDVPGSSSPVPMPDGSTGILVANCLANAANVSITPTTAAGTNSNNKFYSNTIQNCNIGVALMGFAASSPFTLGDTGNDIGGTSAATGNTIINFGGAPASIRTAAAVRLNNQWSPNISYNTINNNNGAGVNQVGNLYGIWGQAGLSANVTIVNNNITLKSGASSATAFCNAIDNAIGITAAGNTVTISNNIITGSYTTATSGSMTGIINTASATTVNMNGNTIDNYALPGTGNWVGIQHNVAGTSNLTINNNTLSNCNITSTGTFFGISNNGSVSNTLSISGNSITGNTKNTTLTLNWLSTASNTATTTTLLNDNIITGNVVNGGTGTVVSCINIGISAYTADNNYIYDNSITGLSSGVGTINGIITGNLTASVSETMTNNTVRKLYITGTSPSSLHLIQGLNSITNSASVKNISNNTISNLYCSSTLSATIYGIRSNQGTTVNIYKNKIDSLFPGQSVTAGSVAAGIRAQTSSTTNIYNNFINLDLTQATAPAANSVLTGSDNVRGLDIADATAGHVVNLYYNTIRLAGGGTGTTAGTSGISIASAVPNVDLRNNIIVNLTSAGGSTGSPVGYAVAYRRPAVVSGTYLPISNNNLFYAGTPSTSHLLYYDLGTATAGNGYQTMAAYSAGVGGGREGASVGNVSPNFINPISNLHLIAGKNCSSDGGGQVIAGYTGDYDADVRSVTVPDIGADEIAGTGAGVGVWIGGTSTDWNNVLNWCDAVPDSKTNVTIPTGSTFYPIITTATPVANNLTVATGGTITITGVGKLGIYGTMSNTGGTFTAVDGTVEMLGGTAQTIPAGMFQNNDLKNLIISNSAASSGVTLGGALNLYGKLSFTTSNRAFATAGFLTLRSTATGTASVGDITNGGLISGNTITGDVSVERFASARRAWRFLSVPTQNNLQTIHEAWQENQGTNSPLPAGFGVSLSKDTANAVLYGYDMQTTAGGSLKTYVPATNLWKPVTSTINVAGVSNGKFVTGTGYMTFVRGDRTVNTFPQAATTTIMRDKGALVTGTFAAPAIGAGLFAAIGNPYASAVSFASLTKTGLQNFYYVWDPQLGTLGGYQTFAAGGPGYVATPGGGSYGTGNYYIESGQAFFVHSSGPAGTLSFTEPSKVDGSNLVQRPMGIIAKQLHTNIYAADASGTMNLFDGVLSQFDANYSSIVNNDDAIKLVNFNENLGIKRADKVLSVERMAELTESDTIFYNLANSKAQNYQFEFIAENIGQPGLSGFLEDNYLHTSTPVNMEGTTKVDFNVVNDPGSYALDRFHLVFKQLGPVPVSFTSVKANKQDKNILVEWKVENELNIHHYDVEKSADGHNFNKVHEEAARGIAGSIQYSWLDTNPRDGDNFYRIRGVGISSDSKLSQVVKVDMGKQVSAITIFPNPVREDGILYVSLDNKPAGNYQVSIVNAEGQTMSKKTLNHAGGNNVYTITADKRLAHGNYLVNIMGDDNVNLTFKVVY